MLLRPDPGHQSRLPYRRSQCSGPARDGVNGLRRRMGQSLHREARGLAREERLGLAEGF